MSLFWLEGLNTDVCSTNHMRFTFCPQFCRSLLVRNHDLGFEYLHQLLQLLDEETEESLALEAARALAIIAEGDGDEVLSKKNHAVIRVRPFPV